MEMTRYFAVAVDRFGSRIAVSAQNVAVLSARVTYDGALVPRVKDQLLFIAVNATSASNASGIKCESMALALHNSGMT